MVPKRPREESSGDEEGEEEERESDNREGLVGDGESWQEVAITKDPSGRGGHRVRLQQEEEEEADWEDLGPIPGSETQSLSEEAIRVDLDVMGGSDDDNDSFVDTESLQGSTSSILSSILDYREIHGRHFQSSRTTEYWAPKDEQMTECLDILHQVTLMLMHDELHLAPIGKNPQVGYALHPDVNLLLNVRDAADEYPSATVIGTDISPVQPGWVPPNCSYQIDDAQLPWTFKEDFFDFIHIRYLYGGIDDWGKLYGQAFTHVRPGGWVESTEIDLTTRSENPEVENDSDHLFKKWRDLFFEAGDKLGRTFKTARDGDQEKLMREAGFVDLVHREWKVPMGSWPKDPRLKQIGLYNGSFIDRSLDGFAVFPIGQILGWTFEEVETLVKNMRAALKAPKSFPYYVIHTVYGRRPKDASASDVESLL